MVDAISDPKAYAREMTLKMGHELEKKGVTGKQLENALTKYLTNVFEAAKARNAAATLPLVQAPVPQSQALGQAEFNNALANFRGNMPPINEVYARQLGQAPNPFTGINPQYLEAPQQPIAPASTLVVQSTPIQQPIVQPAPQQTSLTPEFNFAGESKNIYPSANPQEYGQHLINRNTFPHKDPQEYAGRLSAAEDAKLTSTPAKPKSKLKLKGKGGGKVGLLAAGIAAVVALGVYAYNKSNEAKKPFENPLTRKHDDNPAKTDEQPTDTNTNLNGEASEKSVVSTDKSSVERPVTSTTVSPVNQPVIDSPKTGEAGESAKTDKVNNSDGTVNPLNDDKVADDKKIELDENGEYEVQKGDCVYNIVKAVLIQLGQNPTEADIMAEVEQVRKDNGKEWKSKGDIEKYFIDIYPGEKLKIDAAKRIEEAKKAEAEEKALKGEEAQKAKEEAEKVRKATEEVDKAEEKAQKALKEAKAAAEKADKLAGEAEDAAVDAMNAADIAHEAAEQAKNDLKTAQKNKAKKVAEKEQAVKDAEITE